MEIIGSDSRNARFYSWNRTLQAAAIISCGLLVAAAGFILGGEPAGSTTAAQIGNKSGPERYLTHIATDKPIYRTGEKVYVRGVVLSAVDHSPMSSNAGV